MDILAKNIFVRKHHKKVICVAQNFLETTRKDPIIYDIPLSSVRKSWVETHINYPYEELKVGVNIGILFGEDFRRTNAWDKNRRLENSIMGYFIALKFHNYTLLQQFQTSSSPWMTAMSKEDNCVVSSLVKQAVDPANVRLSLRINDHE